MRFTVSIDCDNAAFVDDPNAEVARILRAIAQRIEVARIWTLEVSGRALDANGNAVATFQITES